MFAEQTEQKGMSLHDFEKIIAQVNNQPLWRRRSQRAADYYDNKQLEKEVIDAMNERGQPVIIHNLIAPTIDGVLGLEARTRTDWMVTADDEEGEEMSEALNHKLKDYTRLGEAGRACSDAYAAQIKAGLGWVEVRKNSDPFGEPLLFEYIHRREIYWDWHAKKQDLSDARWLIRRRWLDKDVAKALLPEHKKLIDQTFAGWRGFDIGQFEANEPDAYLSAAYAEQQQTTLEELEWLDTERERILVNQVYYRVLSKKPVLKMQNGRVIEFQKDNPLHVHAVNSGIAELVHAPHHKMRVAWFLGPHKLEDKESGAPHNYFPFVPFFGFREDSTGIPYGLIERMIPAQDEVNFRRSMLTWLLRAKRVIMDDDATNMSHSDVLDEVNRADGVVILNPNRKNRGTEAFRVEQDIEIAAQQFQVMQDSMKLIQDTAGVYSAFLGQESGAKSGIAINSLVEQGSMTLAEINDNYRFARQQVGELALAFVIDELKGQENVQIRPVDERTGQKKAPITLNQTVHYQNGMREVTNDVTKLRFHIGMTDIQSTPGYRAQLLERMMNVMATLPDELKTLLVPYVIELTDTPNRTDILAAIRRHLGMVEPEEMSEEELQAYKAEQEQAKAQQQAVFDELQARIAKIQAEARRIDAQAAKEQRSLDSMPLDDQKTYAETMKILSEMSKTIEDVRSAKAMALTNIDKQIASMGRVPINRRMAS